MTANATAPGSAAGSAGSSAAGDQAGSRGRLSAPARQLLRFLLVVIFFCGVACLYFAQLSEITAIRRDTTALGQEALRYEQANAALMLDVAAWNRPDYVQSRAGGLGLGPAGRPAYVLLQPDPGRSAAPAPKQPELSSLWQQLRSELAKSWAAVMAVPRDVAQAGR